MVVVVWVVNRVRPAKLPVYGFWPLRVGRPRQWCAVRSTHRRLYARLGERDAKLWPSRSWPDTTRSWDTRPFTEPTA